MTQNNVYGLTNISNQNRTGNINYGYEYEEDQENGPNSRKNNTQGQRKKIRSYLSQAAKPINATGDYIKSHLKTLKYIVLGILGAGYVAYFIAACVLDFQRAIALVVLTCVAVAAVSYEVASKHLGERVSKAFRPVVRVFERHYKWIKWLFILAAVGLLVTWLVMDMRHRPEQLISLGGVCMFILIVYLLSAHRSAVVWRPVFWGLGLQFCIGLFVIRTQPGLVAFQWLGDQVKIFLDYTKEGSSFVFGPLVADIFAFQALPIVVFFSSVMSILYFLGIIQWLIQKISWVMQITMGTSPTETLSVAGNIFIGQTEAPLLIRPYLGNMTKSEIHAIMVGGFATIAGSVMGAFISFGIDAASLISASVMAAPCALAFSKLSYPETEESPYKSKKNVKISAGDEQNILEAASSGASASIGLVANIAANLIAFLAILGFINSALRWFGGMVGYNDLTFQLICSYVFMPLAFMMGIPYDESFTVAELLGIKLFLNEFVAYQKLSDLKVNRLNGLAEVIGGQRQWISVRSEIISTFALCGFANFSSLGIVIGGLCGYIAVSRTISCSCFFDGCFHFRKASICPNRRGDVSSMVLRAMITGTCVSLVNACIAGVLFLPHLDCVALFSGSSFNTTNSDVMTCCADLFQNTVRNRTISFEGSWTNVTNVASYFWSCCDCCASPNVDVCL